jgi:hypothetical protein
MNAALALVLLPLVLLWGGHVTSVLWGWFVVPLGVPGVNVFHAIGLQLVAGTFMLGIAKEKVDDDRALGRLVTISIAYLLALGFGWVFHFFM